MLLDKLPTVRHDGAKESALLGSRLGQPARGV